VGIIMARQVAIVIAVASIRGFPPLPGAASGAQEFAEWARTHGFEVEQFDDAAGPVTGQQLFAAVTSVVDAGDVARLFIYFAGHGLNTGQGDDLWLLSSVRDDPSEAIDVALSVRQARECGVPHVAFFADACRSAPDRSMFDTHGRGLFPRRSIPSVQVEVDQFYATASGDPAWERHPDDPNIPPYGIFSKCLFPALRGERPPAKRSVEGGPAGEAVLAHLLTAYLNKAVPTMAWNEVGRRQDPDCTPGSYWEPNVIAWVPEGASSTPVSLPHDPGPGGAEHIRPDRDDVDSGWIGPPPVPAFEDDPSLGDEVGRNLDAAGRTSFETRAGLSVIGSAIVRTMVEGGDRGVFEESGAWHVRGDGRRPATTLLELEPADEGYSRWATALIIPGYVGTLRVSARGVEQLAYLPTPGTVTELGLDDTTQAVALAGARARWARLDLAEPRVKVALEADLNPTVVLLAAYALDRAGDTHRVYRLAERFADKYGFLPLDLLLLAGHEDVTAGVPVLPDFPLLTRGWSLLRSSPAGRWALAEMRTTLAPTPWTSPVDLPEAMVDVLVPGATVPA
jgi:Caspase domain